MRRCVLFLIMIFSGALAFSQAGNVRYVCVQTEEVKESPSFFARTQGSFSLGDAVTLTREDGKWSQVRSERLNGWVRTSSLSTRRILPSGASATAAEVALAGKGFSPDIEIEYRKNGLDYSMVNSMENNVIAPEELLSFITEGRLARGE